MGSLPIKYLGLPLSSSYPKAVNFQPMLAACRRRLEGWGGKILSVAGKAQLISSVLQNIVNFWIMSFKVPSSILRSLNSLFSKFFWGSSFHPEAWEKVCKPKREGGMNIRSVKEMNQAAGIKLLWSLLNSQSVWSSFMKAKYKIDNNSIMHISSTVYDSGSWKFILQARESAMRKVLSISNGSLSWSVPSPKLFYFWSGIRAHEQSSQVFKSIWFPRCCPKMSLCLLRAAKGTLVTKDLLRRRTSDIDPTCVLCNDLEESATHLFFNCHFSSFIWSVCRLKLGLPQKLAYSLHEEIIFIRDAFPKKSGCRMLARLSIPTVVWHIWRERNNRIFNGKSKSMSEVLKEILDAAMILCTEEAKGGRALSIMENWM